MEYISKQKQCQDDNSKEEEAMITHLPGKGLQHQSPLPCSVPSAISAAAEASCLKAVGT